MLFQTFLTLMNLYIDKLSDVYCIFYFEKRLKAARTIFSVSKSTFVSFEKLIKNHFGNIILCEINVERNFEIPN